MPIASIRDLLKPYYRYGLIFILFIAADHLLADPEAPGQLGLRDALGNSDFRDEGRDLFEPLDLRQI